jgi:hypothetical protein
MRLHDSGVGARCAVADGGLIDRYPGLITLLSQEEL